MKDFDEIMNPLEVRDLLLEKERERILSKDVQPIYRLFHYANSTTVDDNRLKLMSESSRIGQQDCKDFFECIEQGCCAILFFAQYTVSEHLPYCSCNSMSQHTVFEVSDQIFSLFEGFSNKFIEFWETLA